MDPLAQHQDREPDHALPRLRWQRRNPHFVWRDDPGSGYSGAAIGSTMQIVLECRRTTAQGVDTSTGRRCVVNDTEHHFTRTSCACEQCVSCCKRQPGALAAGDLDRIVSFVAQRQGCTLEVAFERVKAQIWASPGALVMDTETGQFRRVGSITPRMRKGRCVFLDQNDRCSIHAVAPFGCAYFDMHMPHSVAHPRSVWLALSTENPSYTHQRKELPYAQSYKPQRY